MAAASAVVDIFVRREVAPPEPSTARVIVQVLQAPPTTSTARVAVGVSEPPPQPSTARVTVQVTAPHVPVFVARSIVRSGPSSVKLAPLASTREASCITSRWLMSL